MKGYVPTKHVACTSHALVNVILPPLRMYVYTPHITGNAVSILCLYVPDHPEALPTVFLMLQGQLLSFGQSSVRIDNFEV